MREINKEKDHTVLEWAPEAWPPGPGQAVVYTVGLSRTGNTLPLSRMYAPKGPDAEDLPGSGRLASDVCLVMRIDGQVHGTLADGCVEACV